MSNFNYEVDGSVAVIPMDQAGEPVNTLSREIGEELDKLLTRAASDESAKAVLIISGKKDNFMAGAKLEMLQSMKTAADATAASKQGQVGFARLEAFEKPVV